MTAWQRQLRTIDRARAGLSRRGVSVVVNARIVTSAARAHTGYWTRRLGLDPAIGRRVRIAVRRPVAA